MPLTEVQLLASNVAPMIVIECPRPLEQVMLSRSIEKGHLLRTLRFKDATRSNQTTIQPDCPYLTRVIVSMH